VGVVINGRTAAIHADTSGLNGLERFKAASCRIKEPQSKRSRA
jgi:hypothetical protein